MVYPGGSDGLAAEVGTIEQRRYSAADIAVLSWDEAVRKRPAMYFGVDQQHPDLATRILAALMTDALHLEDGEHGKMSVEIISDLRFSIVDDQIREVDEQGMPKLDRLGSLLDRRRWIQAAATALSAHTIIEAWAGGRGYRQELVGRQPLAPPQTIAAPATGGTLAIYELDPSYLAPGAAIATSLEGLDLHSEWCAGHSMVGLAVVKDLRRSTAG